MVSKFNGKRMQLPATQLDEDNDQDLGEVQGSAQTNETTTENN
jgi:hypothetical protein